MSECRVTHGNNGRSSLFSLPSFVNYFQIVSAHSTEIWGCQVAVEEVDREKSDNEWNSSSFRRWREGISRWEFLRLFSASLHVKLTLIIQETKAASAAEEVYRKEWNFCRCFFFILIIASGCTLCTSMLVSCFVYLWFFVVLLTVFARLHSSSGTCGNVGKVEAAAVNFLGGIFRNSQKWMVQMSLFKLTYFIVQPTSHLCEVLSHEWISREVTMN